MFWKASRDADCEDPEEVSMTQGRWMNHNSTKALLPYEEWLKKIKKQTWVQAFDAFGSEELCQD